MGLRASVTAMGLVTPWGQDLVSFEEARASGRSGLSVLDSGPVELGGLCEEPALRDILTRRRDKKIFSRCAKLLLRASADAAEGWRGEPEEMGLFFGIRKEPSETGGGDMALIASVTQDRLDQNLLATVGKDLSPPLLPLESLPNMCLAHVSIQLGFRGECGVAAGGPTAGVHAVNEGIAAVAEGRCPAALVGAVDSWVDGPSQRDWVRLGRLAPPAEAAVVFRLEPLGHPDTLFVLERKGSGLGGREGQVEHHSLLGHAGSADALVGALFSRTAIVGVDENGAWAEAEIHGEW